MSKFFINERNFKFSKVWYYKKISRWVFDVAKTATCSSTVYPESIDHDFSSLNADSSHVC